MSYCLPSGVSACMVADRAIFLDTGKDRYFSVSGRSAQAVRAVLEQRPIDAMDVEQLAKAGLIQVADGLPTNVRPPPAAPTRSLVEEAVGPATWGAGHLFEVAARLMRARHRVSRRPLASILDDLAASKADLAPAAPCTARALAYAAKFNASRRFVPVRPRCLPDSLALLAGLGAPRRPGGSGFWREAEPLQRSLLGPIGRYRAQRRRRQHDPAHADPRGMTVPQYLAAIGGFRSPRRIDQVVQAARRLDLDLVFQSDGLTLLANPSAAPIVLSGQRGVVVGTVFQRSGNLENVCPLATTIATTEPLEEDLVRSYWGAYVAFACEPPRRDARVFRDPSGGLGCYWNRSDGVDFAYSECRPGASAGPDHRRT